MFWLPELEVRLDPRAERAERVRALGPRPLVVLDLKVTRTDVVGDRVAEDHLLGVGRWHVLADAADDDRQLTLERDVIREVGPNDGITRTDDGGVRLEEDQRLVWHFAVAAEDGSHLQRMRGVVLSDADDLAARDDRREQADIPQRDLLPGQFESGVQRIALEKRDRLDPVVRSYNAESRVVSVSKSGYTHGR